MTVVLLFLIVAFVLFVVAAFGGNAWRINFTAAGAAFFVLAFLWPYLDPLFP